MTAVSQRHDAAWLPMRGARDGFLALGLRWAPLLGADASSQLRRRARAARASHHILARVPVAMGGWVRLPRSLSRGTVHAGALAYARLYPAGGAMAAVPLPDGRVWVAAVHGGVLLADGDRVCADRGEADRWCDALAGRFPGLPRVSVSLDELADAAGDDTRLARNAGAVGRLPLPFKVVSLLLLAGYGIQNGERAWQFLAGERGEPRQADAGQAWADAIAQAARSAPLHGADDMRAVLDALGGLPVDVSGWLLRTAVCRAQAAGWACEADYARAGHAARNDDLARRVPSGWDVRFGLLDQAVLSWRVRAGGRRLDPASVPRGRDTDLVYASRLQRMRPAFGLLGVGEAADLPVDAPAGADGVPLERPDGLPVLRARPFSAQGPLRSYRLIAEAPPPMAWRELSLELTPERGAGVALSRLVARLQGVLYEQR